MAKTAASSKNDFQTENTAIKDTFKTETENMAANSKNDWQAEVE